MPPLDVLIATPLDPEQARRVLGCDARANVRFEPDLLPPPRFANDHRGDPAFRRTPEGEERWEQLLTSTEVLLAHGDSAEMLARVVPANPQLRWVQGTSAGFGEVVRRAELSPADLQRVTFTSAVGIHAEQLAEWALLGLLAFTKDLARLQRDKENRHWDHYPVRGLAGQTLVVVGLGHIGREVARVGKALGMRVIGTRRSAPTTTDEATRQGVDALCATAELVDVLPSADAVVLALPDTDATRGLFSAELIAALPAHAVLVNIGRGGTVDEPALVDALANGRLAGAALDVFATEPLPADSPLWALDNVILSPHTAALSPYENDRIVELFCDNLQRFLDGRPLSNVVNTDEFY